MVAGWQSSQRNIGGNGDGTPYPQYEYLFDEDLSQASLEMRLRNEQQLADLLDNMAMDPEPPVLSIRADAQLDYQNVITVVDMIKQRNLSKISLDTKVD